MIEPTDTQRKPLSELTLPSFRLLELDVFCKFSQMDRKGALKLFRLMGVPLFYIGKSAYYSEFTLEKAIYVITRPGASGFASPGSSRKHQGGSGIPTEFKGQLKKDFINPALAIEMTAAKSRDMPATLRAMAAIKKIKK